MPQHIATGLKLEEKHIEEIRALPQRRDQHLKRLYDEIRKLNEKLNDSRLRSLAKALRHWIYSVKHRLAG